MNFNVKNTYLALVNIKKFKIWENSYLLGSRGLQSQKWFFDLFFDRKGRSKKGVPHYKPCPLTSLSSGKSWDILALSIEKIDFFIFSYTNFRVYLWALIHKRGYVRSRNCNFFWILHSWINNPTLALFWFRPYFEKFFTLKLKLLKNAFGTRTLKPYRTVNTHPKLTFNSSFCRKQLAKIYPAS